MSVLLSWPAEREDGHKKAPPNSEANSMCIKHVTQHPWHTLLLWYTLQSSGHLLLHQMLCKTLCECELGLYTVCMVTPPLKRAVCVVGM